MQLQKLFFWFLLSLLIFSLYAGFALLVINAYFHEQLPGYTIGRICIWDVLVMMLSMGIGFLIIKTWGSPKVQKVDGNTNYVLNIRYVYFLAAYFTLAVTVAVWQFYLFSQNF